MDGSRLFYRCSAVPYCPARQVLDPADPLLHRPPGSYMFLSRPSSDLDLLLPSDRASVTLARRCSATESHSRLVTNRLLSGRRESGERESGAKPQLDLARQVLYARLLGFPKRLTRVDTGRRWTGVDSSRPHCLNGWLKRIEQLSRLGDPAA